MGNAHDLLGIVTVKIVDGTRLSDTVENGGNVVITGVLWSDRFIYTDSKHIKAE